MPVAVPLIAAGVGAAGSAYAANKGAKATANASKDANALQLKMYEQQRADNEPYRIGGYGAYSAMQGLLGLGPTTDANKAAFDQYQNSTGYQFRLGQGTQAIDRSAAARGGLNSGATLKALANYGQNIGSAEFGNYLNQLQGVIAPGQQALSQNAQAGQNLANQSGNNMMNAANARASAYGTAANAFNGALQDGVGYGASKGWW